MVISNIFVFSFALTYKYELALMVGKSCLATLRSANSSGIRVSALTSKGRSVCSLGSTGGGCCTWLFHIKQKYCIHQHAFLWSNIQKSTFPHQPKAGGPPFLSRTGNVLHAFLLCSFSCPVYIYKNTFRFTPAICKDCTDPGRRLTVWIIKITVKFRGRPG